MKISKERVREIIKEEINELGGFGHDKHVSLTGTSSRDKKGKSKC